MINFVYVVILIVIKIIVVVIVVIFWHKGKKKSLDNKLEGYKKKIFSVKLDDVKVYHMTGDENYERFIKAIRDGDSPRVPTIGEITFLLRYKKFLDRDDVYSMVDDKDVDLNIRLLKNVIENKVDGSIVEAGCWRGGLLMLMKATLNTYERDSNRKIYGLDTFSYFPSPEDNRENNIYFKPNQKDKSIHSIVKILYENYHRRKKVKEHFKKFNLWDHNVKLIEGEFTTTIPKLDLYRDRTKISILRIDSDYHNSVYYILSHLYILISPGGFIIIDDYYNAAVDCKRAVDRFRREISHIEFPPIINEHNGNIYWQVKL